MRVYLLEQPEVLHAESALVAADVWRPLLLPLLLLLLQS
jgi:hypothetical protein